MNDQEADIQIARIQKYLKRWMGAGFGWWRLDIEYERGNKTGFEGCIENANILEHWQYRAATITFNLPAVEQLTDERLEEMVVHELSHLLIGSIRDYSNDAQRQMTEFAVTNIARSLVWASKMDRSDC